MTSKSKKFMLGLLSFLLLFNIVDAAFTIVWLKVGIREANPIMGLTVHSMPIFILSKATIVIWGCAILWFFREKPIAKYGIYGLTCFYFAVTLMHVWLSWIFITKVMT